MLNIMSMFESSLQLSISEDDFIYKIYCGGLHKIDVNTLNSEFFQISVEGKNPWHATSICKLRNKKLFCSGVYYEGRETTDNAFILDINAFQVTALPNIPQISESGIINIDRFVYSFGGKVGNVYNSEMSRLSYRFDLINSRWQRIADIPNLNCQMSCIEYERNIIIAGFYDQLIYLYDCNTNSYTALFSFTANTPKILFKYDSQLFLLVGRELWLSDLDNPTCWELVKEILIQVPYVVTSNVIVKENFAYFALNFVTFVKLDFETYELKETTN